MTDEGIKKLKDLRKKYELLAKYNGGEDYIAFKVLDMAVKELSHSEKPNKWIPVSERLPEKNMECLVAVGKFNFTQMAMYSDLMGTIDHRIFYQGDYGHRGFVDITQYVNAWMPLPEPYVAEEGGE